MMRESLMMPGTSPNAWTSFWGTLNGCCTNIKGGTTIGESEGHQYTFLTATQGRV